MMSPEFRTKLEDIMRDWYADQDAGEMHLSDLIMAISDISKTYNPSNQEFPGAVTGLLGGMAGAMFLMKNTFPDLPDGKT